ncbi:hypothetical protein [Bradyrhizobium sp. Leaf401]|uniref:hypothetical protein n=1 Tax=Bradyrhizobium sp. Leaf401 TaxID=2876564 RepID=UPI001E62BCE7|nr:hypothetical protein [Bradyrhizobium sp. Leaf401]
MIQHPPCSAIQAVSRQGWQPERGKTRSRGFSAANSPARRATPTFVAVRGAQQPIYFGDRPLSTLNGFITGINILNRWA